MAGMSPRIKAKKGRFGDLGLAAVVRITSPNTNSTYVRTGSPLTVDVDVTATATDDLTGDVSAGISWTSSLDGAVGSGGASDTLSLTTAGTHVLTASASHGSPAGRCHACRGR